MINEQKIKEIENQITESPNDPMLHNELGMIYHDRGEYKKAIASFNKAIKMNRKNVDFFYNRANSYYHDKNYEEADIDCDKILDELNPKHQKTIELRRNIKQRSNMKNSLTEDNIMNMVLAEKKKQEGLMFADRMDYDKAIECFLEAVKLSPNDEVMYNNLGLAYSENGDKDNAIINYKKALELKPDYSLAYSNLGIAYRATGNLYEAINQYNMAIKYDPNYADVYINLGNVLEQLDRDEEALESFSKAVKLNPNEARYYTNRATAYMKLKQFDNAIADYDRAVELNPNDYFKAQKERSLDFIKNAKDDSRLITLVSSSDASKYNSTELMWQELMMSPVGQQVMNYLDNGNYNGAIESLTKLIELSSNNNYSKYSYYCIRGGFYLQIKNYEKALEDFKKSIEIKPNADAYAGISNVHMLKDEIEEALINCNKGIEIDDKISSLYSIRSRIYLEQNRLDEALSDCKKALDFNKEDINAHMNIANVYGELERYNKQDYELALSHCDEAIKLYEEFESPVYIDISGAYSTKSAMYTRLEMYDLALENGDKAISINPKSDVAYINRGLAYIEQEKYEKALNDFNSSIAIDENYYRAYHNRGLVYYKLDRPLDAIHDYKKALTIKNDFVDTYVNLGLIYLDLAQDVSEYIEDNTKYKEIETIFYECPSVKSNKNYDQKLKFFEIKNVFYREALTNFNEAVRLDPKDADNYYDRGTAYAKSGEHKKAVNDYDKALEIDSSFTLAQFAKKVSLNELEYKYSKEFEKQTDMLGDTKLDNINQELIEILPNIPTIERILRDFTNKPDKMKNIQDIIEQIMFRKLANRNKINTMTENLMEKLEHCNVFDILGTENTEKSKMITLADLLLYIKSIRNKLSHIDPYKHEKDREASTVLLQYIIDKKEHLINNNELITFYNVLKVLDKLLENNDKKHLANFTKNFEQFVKNNEHNLPLIAKLLQ